jgi:1,4-alpha-glucan branching enzyme
MNEPDEPWWKTAVLYQIYPLSFADSNGDGLGDIGGVIEHLDHLEWLGIDGIWLSPITASPNADWGYDVSDFCAIQPAMGTMADFDHLVDQARQRGIRGASLVRGIPLLEKRWSAGLVRVGRSGARWCSAQQLGQ